MGGSKKDPDLQCDISSDSEDDGECSTDDEEHRRGHSRSPKRHGGKRSRSRSRSPIRSRRSRSRSVERRHTSSHALRRSRSRSRSPMTPPYRRERCRSPMNGERRPFVLTREDPEPSRCLGVFGMSLYTTERDLTNFFGRFGKIESVTIIYDHDTQTSRGFGFVNFERLKEAIEARNQATGAEIDGVSVRVDFSLTKRPHAPTPGIYMGSSRPRSHGYGGDRGGRFHRGGDYRGDGYRGAYRSRGQRHWNNGDGYGGGDHRGRRSGSPYDHGDRQRRSRSVERDCY